jgi:hypothetical protein
MHCGCNSLTLSPSPAPILSVKLLEHLQPSLLPQTPCFFLVCHHVFLKLRILFQSLCNIEPRPLLPILSHANFVHMLEYNLAIMKLAIHKVIVIHKVMNESLNEQYEVIGPQNTNIFASAPTIGQSRSAEARRIDASWGFHIDIENLDGELMVLIVACSLAQGSNLDETSQGIVDMPVH